MVKWKFICEYAEFGDKTSRRIKDHISDDPIPDKKKLQNTLLRKHTSKESIANH